MAASALEERVAHLETEVRELKRHLMQEAPADRPWWERIAGTFANDPAFEEAMHLGRQYREAQGSAKTDKQDDDVSA